MLARDPKTKVVVAIHSDDIGTPERQQHGVKLSMRGVDVVGGGIVRDGVGAEAQAESLIDLLDNDGWLGGAYKEHFPTDEMLEFALPSKRQRADARSKLAQLAADRERRHRSRREAACWVKEVFHRAGLMPNVIAKYSPLSTGEREVSDAEEIARREFRQMWLAIGEANASILQAVCGHDQLPRGLTALRLREALDAVAQWKGL